MAESETKNVYAPVKMTGDSDEGRRIIEDGTDPIDNTVEEAIATFKGHIEKQDEERA